MSKWTRGRDAEGAGACAERPRAWQGPRAGRSRRDSVLAMVCAQALERARHRRRAAFGVLHRKYVERETVGGGERLGVHDGAARHGDGAGELREQAGMIGRVEHDVGDGAERVAFGVQRQKLAARIGLRPSAGHGVPCSSRRRRPASNCRNGALSARSRCSGVKSASRAASAALAAATRADARRRLVAARHHVLGGVIKLAQQLALPAVPHARTHGANVGDSQDQQQAQHFRRLHLAPRNRAPSWDRRYRGAARCRSSPDGS